MPWCSLYSIDFEKIKQLFHSLHLLIVQNYGLSLWKCKWDECVCWVQVWVASISVSKCCKVWPSIFIMYLNNDKCWKLLLKTQFIIIHNIYSNCNTTLSHFKTWDRISSNLSSYHFRHEFKIKFILHSIWTYQNTSYNIYFWYFTTFLLKNQHEDFFNSKYILVTKQNFQTI